MDGPLSPSHSRSLTVKFAVVDLSAEPPAPLELCCFVGQSADAASISRHPYGVVLHVSGMADGLCGTGAQRRMEESLISCTTSVFISVLGGSLLVGNSAVLRNRWPHPRCKLVMPNVFYFAFQSAGSVLQPGTRERSTEPREAIRTQKWHWSRSADPLIDDAVTRVTRKE